MRFLLTVLAVWLLATGAARAENTVFDLKIRGLTVGVIYMTSRVNENGYAVGGVIQNTGLTRVIRRFSYRGSVRGRFAGARPMPDRYQETADTGRRKTELRVDYINGVPNIVHYVSDRPESPDAPDPATQGGTVDSLTAVWALLRDTPRGAACQLDLYLFDGRRRGRIWMQPAGEEDGLPVCRGRYERLEGYTAKEVSRHRWFDFKLTYSDLPDDMLRVERVAFDSYYGTAAIDRR